MHNKESKNNNSHGDKLFILIEQYFPKEGKLEEIIKIAKKSSERIYDVKGLLMANVLRPKTKTGPVCNITTWESEDDFNAFMKSDAVAELMKSDSMKNVKEWTSEIKVLMFNVEDGWHK